MAKSTITEIFQADIKTVWNKVTDNGDWTWRSDIERIEVLDGGVKFIEYTKDGFATTFTITRKEAYSQYEFDIENKNMTGHWKGLFQETANGIRITFTEEIIPKNPVMKLFVGGYLKKQQRRYVEDLKRAL